MLKCSFCGLPETQDRVLINGINNISICNECIITCEEHMKNNKKYKKIFTDEKINSINIEDAIFDIFEESENEFINKEDFREQLLDTKTNKNYYTNNLNIEKDIKSISISKDNINNSDNFKNFKPSQIKLILDDYIIGQEKAKKILSVAIYNHYKRINSEKNIKKGNIMMVGPTGSGKTYLLETLSKIIKVPFVTVDATSFTEVGYAGEDVDSMIEDLFLKSGKDIEQTEKGIIYIDEIDKISAKQQDNTSSVDVGGIGVQQSLLKLMEGTDITIGLGMYEEVKINTSNILFVCGGAFSNLDNVIEKSKPIGFNNDINKSLDINKESKTITHDDIIDYGFIPEFVGRVPILVQLDKLNKDDLLNILTNTKDSIIKEYIELFKMDDVKLTFDEEALDLVAQKAIDKNIGARGLRGVLEQTMYDIMFDLPDSNIDHINITKEMIENNL